MQISEGVDNVYTQQIIDANKTLPFREFSRTKGSMQQERINTKKNNEEAMQLICICRQKQKN